MRSHFQHAIDSSGNKDTDLSPNFYAAAGDYVGINAYHDQDPYGYSVDDAECVSIARENQPTSSYDVRDGLHLLLEGNADSSSLVTSPSTEWAVEEQRLNWERGGSPRAQGSHSPRLPSLNSYPGLSSYSITEHTRLNPSAQTLPRPGKHQVGVHSSDRPNKIDEKFNSIIHTDVKDKLKQKSLRTGLTGHCGVDDSPGVASLATPEDDLTPDTPKSQLPASSFSFTQPASFTTPLPSSDHLPSSDPYHAVSISSPQLSQTIQPSSNLQKSLDFNKLSKISNTNPNHQTSDKDTRFIVKHLPDTNHQKNIKDNPTQSISHRDSDGVSLNHEQQSLVIEKGCQSVSHSTSKAPKANDISEHPISENCLAKANESDLNNSIHVRQIKVGSAVEEENGQILGKSPSASNGTLPGSLQDNIGADDTES